MKRLPVSDGRGAARLVVPLHEVGSQGGKLARDMSHAGAADRPAQIRQPGAFVDLRSNRPATMPGKFVVPQAANRLARGRGRREGQSGGVSSR